MYFVNIFLPLLVERSKEVIKGNFISKETKFFEKKMA